MEDDDATRQVQTKAVLSSVPTNRWEITAGLLRASADDSDLYGHGPTEGGRAGGVVLIEIEDSSDEGTVVYSYTDYEILTAIAEGYLVETPGPQKPGPKPKPAREEAQEALELVWSVARQDKVWLSRRLFVRLTNADQLLGVIGMGSNWVGFARYVVKDAYEADVEVDPQGKVVPGPDVNKIAALFDHVRSLVEAQPANTKETKSALFRPFEWERKALNDDADVVK